MTSDYVRNQPDFFAVGPASAPAAIDMGHGIWCSPGMSSSYLVTTDDGRVVVNTGMWFEGRTHKRNYDAVTTAPTRYIVLTQSHTDHIGGIDRFREDGTVLVAQSNIATCQADDVRIHGLRIRRSLPFFADVMGQPDFVRGDEVELPPLAKPAEPDVTFAERYLIECGGRRFELISVPGGETIDSLVVWLPDDGVALVGNMFSALFGHFPNLVTMRGDRMRSALAFVDSVQTVIDLDAEMLLLGHHGPVRGAATVRAECERIRDATLYVHDATVAAMNDGQDVWTAMREITPAGAPGGRRGVRPHRLECPRHLGVVRGLVPPALDARPLRRGAGIRGRGADRSGGRGRCGRDTCARHSSRPTHSPRCDCASSCSPTDPQHRGALTAYRSAHEQLLAEHGRANFWLTSWLEGEIRSASNRIARLDQP